MSGRVLCDYCGCPPARHENLVKKARTNSDGGADSPRDLLEENSQSDLSEVSSLEILELEDTTEEDESAEATEEDSANSSTFSISSRKTSGYLFQFFSVKPLSCRVWQLLFQIFFFYLF